MPHAHMLSTSPISSSRRKPGPSASARRKALGPGFRRDDEKCGDEKCGFAAIAGIVFALAMMFSSPTHAIDPLPFKDHTEELRFQALTRQLRCLVCQNESLADSKAPLAADLRRDVFEQMQSGKSDDEIKTWLTARYSDFVLYDPPLRAGTWLLWFGPLLVLAVGGAAVFMIVRRRARLAPTQLRAAVRPAADVEDDW
jgi:cytochrome c-type biogenesis protein CcmH